MSVQALILAAIPSILTGIVILLVKMAARDRSEIGRKLDLNTNLTVQVKQKIEDLEARVARQNGRIDKLETWRDRHLEWLLKNSEKDQ